MKTTNVILTSVILLGGGAVAYFYFKNKKPFQSATTTTAAGPKPPGAATTVKNTSDPIVAQTNVASTAVNTPTVTLPPVIAADGTLSGSTPATTPAETQATDANYAANLNKANIAFEELKLLKSALSNYRNRAGTCRGVSNAFQSCTSLYIASDDTMYRNQMNRLILAKEKEIFNLGFKAVGDKLFLI